MTNISAYYHKPNVRFGECGSAYITTEIDTASSEQLENFNKVVKRILGSLNNLVSSRSKETAICPINEGKRSLLTFSIFLAGNPWEKGQYEINAMDNEEIFKIAKEIIIKGISAKEESTKEVSAKETRKE